MELIVYQGVESKLTDQYARILLSINKITKEERLLGLLLAEVDYEGICKVINGSRDRLCSIVGIEVGVYNSYISKWKRMEILEKNGDYLTFKKYIQPDTKYIAIACQSNGMVVKLCKETNGME